MISIVRSSVSPKKFLERNRVGGPGFQGASPGAGFTRRSPWIALLLIVASVSGCGGSEQERCSDLLSSGAVAAACPPPEPPMPPPEPPMPPPEPPMPPPEPPMPPPEPPMPPPEPPMPPPEPPPPPPVPGGYDGGTRAQFREDYPAISQSGGYRRHSALGAIGAGSAHARGFAGQGVTIGMLDTPVPDVPGFGQPGKLARMGLLPEPGGNLYTHGAIVGLVAAGDDRDGGFVGVAPRASLVSYGLDAGPPGFYYEPVELDDPEGWSEADAFFAEAFSDLFAQGVDIINVSVGYPGLISLYEESQVRAHFPNMIRTLAQSEELDRVAVVVAAGNAHGDLYLNGNLVDAAEPELLPGLPHLAAELQGVVLAVAATRAGPEGETIAFYSNRCGVAADFCLAAPGYVSGFLPSGGGFAAGTSFAAPRVAGALAVLASMSADPETGERTVTMQEIIARLLATANSEGIYADTAIYGQGLLDLDKATAPVGEVTIALGETLDGHRASLDDAGLYVDAFASSAIASALQDLSVTVFDSLDFPFRVSLGALLRRPRQAAGMQRELAFGMAALRPSASATFQPVLPGRYGEGHSLAFEEADTAEIFRFRHLAVAGSAAGFSLAPSAFSGSLRMNMLLETAKPGAYEVQSPVRGFLGQWRQEFAGGFWRLLAGALFQQQGLLHLRGEGGLNPGDAEIGLLGFSLYAPLGRSWRLTYSAMLAVAQAEGAAGSLFADWDGPLLSSEYAFGLARASAFREGDFLALQLRQLPYVERGRALLRLPVARELDGSLRYRSEALSLGGGTRPLQLELRYQRPLLAEGRLGLLLAAGEEGEMGFDWRVLMNLRLKLR